jgi:hypothetical protein
MKRILFVLLALVLTLSLAGGALAANPKPPNRLCLELETFGTPNQLTLSIKPSGTVKTSGNTSVKFHSITGEFCGVPGVNIESIPLTGGGHVNDSGVFHFSVTGSALYSTGDNQIWTYFFEGKWDLVNNTGTYSTHNFSSGGEHNVKINDNLILKNCTDEVIPYKTPQN